MVEPPASYTGRSEFNSHLPNMNIHFSSKKSDWTTPQSLFDELNEEFMFTIDVASSADNAKCKRFYTKEENGLIADWSGERVFCNPPYGREIVDWVKKMSEGGATLCVGLLPARTDTRWFHDYILGKAHVRFLRGRLKFGASKNSAPFPSMIVIWSKNYDR